MTAPAFISAPVPEAVTTAPIGIPAVGNCPLPVSYTHLDVYKRQKNRELDNNSFLEISDCVCSRLFPAPAPPGQIVLQLNRTKLVR